MRVGFLHSLIRPEEKLLIKELKSRSGVDIAFIDDRKLVFDLREKPEIDIVLERCINHSRAMHALRLFEGVGVPCINRYAVARRCGDKILTAAALEEHGVAQPPLRVAFTEESALRAIEELGYPVVLKPAVGLLGPAAFQGERPRGGGNDPRAQVDSRLLPSLDILHPEVRREERPGHPQLRGRRRVHRRDLPELAALDHQHCPRCAGERMPGDLGSSRRFASRRPRRRGGILAIDLFETEGGSSSTRSTTRWSSGTASTPPESTSRPV